MDSLYGGLVVSAGVFVADNYLLGGQARAFSDPVVWLPGLVFATESTLADLPLIGQVIKQFDKMVGKVPPLTGGCLLAGFAHALAGFGLLRDPAAAFRRAMGSPRDLLMGVAIGTGACVVANMLYKDVSDKMKGAAPDA